MVGNCYTTSRQAFCVLTVSNGNHVEFDLEPSSFKLKPANRRL